MPVLILGPSIVVCDLGCHSTAPYPGPALFSGLAAVLAAVAAAGPYPVTRLACWYACRSVRSRKSPPDSTIYDRHFRLIAYRNRAAGQVFHTREGCPAGLLAWGDRQSRR